MRLTDGAVIDTAIPAAAARGIGPLTLGVRAEHVHAGGGAPARVDVIERLGDRTLIYAMLTTVRPSSTMSQGTRRAHRRSRGAVDRRHEVHLFDATGRAYHAG